MRENKKGKISLYIKDAELRHDIELLALYDEASITDLVSNALQAYANSRAEDIDFMRRQEQEITDYKQRRSNHDG